MLLIALLAVHGFNEGRACPTDRYILDGSKVKACARQPYEHRNDFVDVVVQHEMF
jgi:hypothetical protein